MISVTLDDSRARTILNDLQRATGEDMATLIHTEGRHLANACTKASAPKSRQRTAKKIDGQISAVFSDNYEPNIEAENQGRGDLKWMIAGPHFLYGLPTALDFRGKSDIYSDYKAFTDAGGKGIVPAGSRGKQRVSIINRIVANKGAVTKLRKSLKSHIGRAKAAWAQSAQALGETNIPEWISKHFPTPKAITFKQTFGDKPSITIGSRAPGVEKAATIFQRALKRRLNSMANRTKLILSGYSRDVAQGIRPTQHAHETQPEGE